MTKIILELPADKMKAFFQAVHPLGIKREAIIIQDNNENSNNSKNNFFKMNRIAKSYKLFDWEFYSNELEFE